MNASWPTSAGSMSRQHQKPRNHPLGGCGANKIQKTLKKPMIALSITPLFAAAGYSLIYLLGGGGLVGAILIFVVAKMFGK